MIWRLIALAVFFLPNASEGAEEALACPSPRGQGSKTDELTSSSDTPDDLLQTIRKSSDPFVQPDSTRWALVSKEMTEREILTLLGVPLHRTELMPDFIALRKALGEEKSKGLGYLWTYGWLRYDSPAFPEPYRFYVYFVDGKVWSVSDPFHGALSSKGRPTVPKLILPKDREVFYHSPPFLDLRWYPSAGDYPIEYEVEIETGQIGDGFNEERWRRRGDEVSSERQSVSAPQLTITFGGINPGRWRVRAKNSLGASDWSDYRYFTFSD